MRGPRADHRHPGVGEEEGGERAATEWLVDPLDGTANFVHGLDAVGVSIGLVEHGTPVVGVVHAPLLPTYDAHARPHLLGDAAVERSATAGASRSSRRPEQAIVATGFPSDASTCCPSSSARSNRRCTGSRTSAGSARPASTCAGWRKACSTVSSSCASVRGTLAAAAIVVREAGGIVTDWDADPDAWLASGSILAAPPAVHAALLELASLRSRTEPTSSPNSGSEG